MENFFARLRKGARTLPPDQAFWYETGLFLFAVVGTLWLWTAYLTFRDYFERLKQPTWSQFDQYVTVLEFAMLGVGLIIWLALVAAILWKTRDIYKRGLRGWP